MHDACRFKCPCRYSHASFEYSVMVGILTLFLLLRCRVLSVFCSSGQCVTQPVATCRASMISLLHSLLSSSPITSVSSEWHSNCTHAAVPSLVITYVLFAHMFCFHVI